MKILLTGSSKGLGKKIYNHLKKEHNVFTIQRSISYNKNHFQCDLRNEKKIKSISKQIPALDVIINNAGISYSSKNKIENFYDIINTTLNFSFLCFYNFFKSFKKIKKCFNNKYF